VTNHASGTFDVKLTPEATDAAEEGTPLGRLALEKRFHGELEAASRGTMLTAGNPASGSAGYVAVERVSGSLQGRRGTFALQHSGTMTQGVQQLTIAVVPGSGTGELEGLAGTLTILIEGGTHSYDLAYTLPER
jgi:hypothetical protein